MGQVWAATPPGVTGEEREVEKVLRGGGLPKTPAKTTYKKLSLPLRRPTGKKVPKIIISSPTSSEESLPQRPHYNTSLLMPTLDGTSETLEPEPSRARRPGQQRPHSQSEILDLWKRHLKKENPETIGACVPGGSCLLVGRQTLGGSGGCWGTPWFWSALGSLSRCPSPSFYSRKQKDRGQRPWDMLPSLHWEREVCRGEVEMLAAGRSLQLSPGLSCSVWRLLVVEVRRSLAFFTLAEQRHQTKKKTIALARLLYLLCSEIALIFIFIFLKELF